MTDKLRREKADRPSLKRTRKRIGENYIRRLLFGCVLRLPTKVGLLFCPLSRLFKVPFRRIGSSPKQKFLNPNF